MLGFLASRSRMRLVASSRARRCGLGALEG